MTWARLDDGLHNHEKFMGFGPVTTPRELWVVALSWTHQNFRRHTIPGFVPASMPTVWAGTKTKGNRLAARLAESGLWETTDTGWVFHDWLDYASPDERTHFGADTTPDSGSDDTPPDGETLRDKRRRAGQAGGRASAARRTTTGEASKSEASAEASASASSSKSEASAATPNPVAEPEPKAPPKQVASPASGSVPRGEANGGQANPPTVLEGQQPQGRGRSTLPPATAVGNQLLAEHVAAHAHKPPRDEQKWASNAIEKHLAEGIDAQFVRIGLALLREAQEGDPSIGAGLLAKYIRQAMNGARPGMGANRGRTSSAAERQEGLKDLHAELTGQMPISEPFLPGTHLVVLEGQPVERSA